VPRLEGIACCQSCLPWSHSKATPLPTFSTGGRTRQRGRTLGSVSIGNGAILCDFEGCWNALLVSSAHERIDPPVDDIIQHRAWAQQGWRTDNEGRDLCSRH